MSGQALLVAGASGHLGRRALEQLLESGKGPLIATTRTPERLADLEARGVEIRHADYDSPESLPAAFSGAHRMLLVSTDAVLAPGQRLQQHRAAIAAAQSAGVRHVVYTSVTAPRPGTGSPIDEDHYWTEHALADSTMEWTILRNALYADLLLMTATTAAATGQIVSATENQGRTYIPRSDCADVAAAVVGSNTSGRAILDVTGNELVTQGEIAQWISRRSGKSISHLAISADQLLQEMQAAGYPEPLAAAMVGFDKACAEGYAAIRTSVVRDFLGREAVPVFSFLEKAWDSLPAQ
ncbi:NAD(P)H-binding protein [Novosphingobium pentaromativorans]|uniref:NAD(P)-binding domain-containing protein n=1 Tax=Novosphingobium pentaromativorans US6-1 TaxID=1088721 RepID=G6EGP4_9SPHN|nr:NAD(P)H-binding protein [Novosphingobium pentaromativorans]AIT82103.1 hypothetical protein JI59_21445 [Novosphingobium pentaromativorans US6-1]EHJ59487.1 hypothetical protein NSU_3515 [Novosphingobium pentaromativorans US6-1]